jgi:hypothetical protein
VVFGKTSSTAVNLASVATGTGGFAINGQAASDFSGWSVAGAGDVNGDGLDDLLIGAYASDPRTVSGLQSAAGRSYVVFGKTSGAAVDLASVAAGTGGFVINGQTGMDFSGWSVAAAGDVNGDGLADVIVGAQANSPVSGGKTLTAAGRAYVVFGKTNGDAVDLLAMANGSSAAGFVINGQAAYDSSGWSVAGAGDVNGDGLADVLIGAPSSDPSAGLSAGRSYLVLGKTSTTAVDLASLAAGDGSGLVIEGQTAGDGSGWSVAGAGDVNGDGFADLLIGAPNASPTAGSLAGRSYVVFGGMSALTATVFDSTAGDAIGTKSPDVLAGTSDNNQLVGGSGADRLSGNGGADVVYGGSGNDAIVLNASNLAVLGRSAGNESQNILRVDGGSGMDSIVLQGAGLSLDLTAAAAIAAVRNIEIVNISGSGANRVLLSLTSVLRLGRADVFTSRNTTGLAAHVGKRQFMLQGGVDDVLQLSDFTDWHNTGSTVVYGPRTYVVWEHNTVAAQLLVQVGMLVE